MLEHNFMTAMIKSDGNLLGFFERPIAAGLGTVTLLVWLLLVTMYLFLAMSRQALLDTVMMGGFALTFGSLIHLRFAVPERTTRWWLLVCLGLAISLLTKGPVILPVFLLVWLPLIPGAAAMRPWLGERFGNPSSPHAFGRAAREAIEARFPDPAALPEDLDARHATIEGCLGELRRNAGTRWPSR